MIKAKSVVGPAWGGSVPSSEHRALAKEFDKLSRRVDLFMIGVTVIGICMMMIMRR